MKEVDLEEDSGSVRNINTTHGVIQLIVKDSRPFQVTGYMTVPTIEFADFRSNETYITVICMTNKPISDIFVLSRILTADMRFIVHPIMLNINYYFFVPHPND